MKRELICKPHCSAYCFSIRMDRNKAHAMMFHKYYHPCELIAHDLDNYKCHYPTYYLSTYQCKRILKKLGNYDYLDEVEYKH